MCRGGSAGGLKIPTNGLRDPVERFCDGILSRWVFKFTPDPGLDKAKQGAQDTNQCTAMYCGEFSYMVLPINFNTTEGPLTSIPNMTFLVDNMICLLNIGGVQLEKLDVRPQ